MANESAVNIIYVSYEGVGKREKIVFKDCVCESCCDKREAWFMRMLEFYWKFWEGVEIEVAVETEEMAYEFNDTWEFMLFTLLLILLERDEEEDEDEFTELEIVLEIVFWEFPILLLVLIEFCVV